MFTSDFVSVNLNFEGKSTKHKEKHPQDITNLQTKVLEKCRTNLKIGSPVTHHTTRGTR